MITAHLIIQFQCSQYLKITHTLSHGKDSNCV